MPSLPDSTATGNGRANTSAGAVTRPQATAAEIRERNRARLNASAPPPRPTGPRPADPPPPTRRQQGQTACAAGGEDRPLLPTPPQDPRRPPAPQPPFTDAEFLAVAACCVRDLDIARSVFTTIAGDERIQRAVQERLERQSIAVGEGNGYEQPTANGFRLIFAAAEQHWRRSSLPPTREAIAITVRAATENEVDNPFYTAAGVELAIDQVFAAELPPRAQARELAARYLEEQLQAAANEILSTMGPPAGGLANTLADFAERVKRVRASVAGDNSNSRFRVWSAEDLDRADLDVTWIVDGIIVQNEFGVILGPKKGCKTSLMVGFAVAIAGGQPAFNRFDTSRCYRTVVCTAESNLRVVRNIARRAARELGFASLEAVPNLHFVGAVPRIDNVADWQEFLDRVVEEHEPEVLALDPFYLMHSGDAAANIFSMGAIIDVLIRLGKERGITILLLHHFRSTIDKREQFEPADLDHAAYAGIAEAAAQWILISRREKYQIGSGSHKLWLGVGGREGHDSLWSVDVEEGDPDRPASRRLQVTFQRAGEGLENDRQRREMQRQERREAELDARDQRNMDRITGALATCPGQAATRRKLRARTGITNTDVLERAIDLLILARRIGERKAKYNTTELYLLPSNSSCQQTG